MTYQQLAFPQTPIQIRLLSKEKRIAFLLEWSDSYYNKNESIVPDNVFDIHLDLFKKDFPNDPFLYTIGAPVRHSAWPKAHHEIPMGSLNKVNSYVEAQEWYKSCGGNEIVVSEKLDGISIELIYEEGILREAITRGDGVIGEDITANVKRMRNVPKRLKNWSGSLRGEIILVESDFKRINEICEKRGEPKLKNLRNGASGVAKRRDGAYVEYLTVIYFDVIIGDQSWGFENKSDKFKYISSELGLCTSFVISTTGLPEYADRMSEINSLYNKYENHRRADLTYDIDGLVVEIDSLSQYNDLGELHKRPKGAIAWKFESLKAQTILKDVIWQLGKQGKLTPVAILEPIQLGGVTVEKASLHNVENVEKMELCKLDKVVVSRRNDVIPYIESVLETEMMFRGQKIVPPTSCPSCDRLVERDGPFVICKHEDCPGREIGNLKKWLKVLDVKGIGPETIDVLYSKGIVKNPADFYTLKPEDMAGLDGFGKRKAQIIVDAVRSKMTVDLPEFVGGLNIPNFSTSMVRLLVDAGYDTLDKLKNVTYSQMLKIRGIESSKARAFITGFSRKLDTCAKLIANGIEINSFESPSPLEVEGIFVGKSFCFTGAIQAEDENGDRYTRKMMEKLVVDNGGTVSSVKKGLSYLVQADPNSHSEKTKKAMKLGVTVMSESNFFSLLGIEH